MGAHTSLIAIGIEPAPGRESRAVRLFPAAADGAPVARGAVSQRADGDPRCRRRPARVHGEAASGLDSRMTTAPDLPGLVSRAESLYRDYKLGAVREWKARTGGLAIGYMPIYIPSELLHAQGVLPVGLM